MFISTKYSGYNRHGEQVASGLFLILCQPHYSSAKYPNMPETCARCGKTRAEHEVPLTPEVQAISDKLHRVWKHMFEYRHVEDTEHLRDAVETVLNAKHEVEGCRYFAPSMVTYPIRALVRRVSMGQFGQFMMGRARAFGETIILSGSYGGDGLPTMVSDKVYDSAIEIPAELYDAWKNGGGWNSAGSEAGEMRKWAVENLAKLRGKE